MRRGLVVVVVIAAGCGRLRFDETSRDPDAGGPGDARRDGADIDAPVDAMWVASTFGSTQIGATLGGQTADNGRVSRYHLAQPADVVAVTMYFVAAGAPQPSIGVIYADNANTPSQLLARSAEVLVAPPGGWIDFPIAPAVRLAAGDYWLGDISGGTNTTSYAFEAIPSEGYIYIDPYADGPAPLLSPTGGPDGRQLSVYAKVLTAP